MNVQALVAVFHSGWQEIEHLSGVKEDEACVNVGLPVLLRTLEDYTTDRRGDVGSLCAIDSCFRFCIVDTYLKGVTTLLHVCRIREAGMHAVLGLCHQLMRNQLLPDSEMSTILVAVTCKLLRQAAERIARIRETAARTMMHLLEYQVHQASAHVIRRL